MEFTISVWTDIVDRDNNEDYFAVDVGEGIFVIADGMGGHSGGEIASKAAVSSAHVALLRGEACEDVLRTANEAVVAAAEKAGFVCRMSGHFPGTTLSFLRFQEDGALFGHVGDSRIYVLADGVMTQVTQDHTQAQLLVDQGHITKEQASSTRYGGNILTSCLGVQALLKTQVGAAGVRPGDVFLLTTDGVHDVVSESDIYRILSGKKDRAELLVQAAMEASSGSGDNATAVVIQVN